MRELEKIIIASLQLWNDSWYSSDFDGVIKLWDDQDKQPYFLSANQMRPLTKFIAIRSYIEESCKYYDSIQNKVSGLIIKGLDPNTALTFYKLQLVKTKEEQSTTGNVRTTVIWRRLKNDWKVFHYSEAPLAPLIELQNFYEEIAKK
ncbi:MAG: hypothetical protein CMM25_09690 [Rhodospirillaceae bacterium]|nr:hypothetical protein [Rhodospirillaceae bacterium]|tara:strand:+ start:766 stop:1206 length:441 start_codon:yes stop_codon:yes gene_type:complete